MKKTLDVNIAGYIYHIDDDAYEILSSYLNKLKNHYKRTDEGEEIINDIEHRIAELFNDRKDSDNKVFSTNDVNFIIDTLGRPEEIFSDEDSNSKQTIYEKTKKLYRDDDNRVLGGVCAGLSSYFGIPIILIRIVFLILFLAGYGFPFLIYIVLWIVTPKAITPRQKLEMKGEAINVSNIEKKIKEEYNEVKKNSPKIKNKMNSFGKTLDSTLNSLGNILRVLIGVGLAGLGCLITISFITSLFMANLFFLPFGDILIFNALPELLLSSANITLLYISIALIVCIPSIFIAFVGFKMIFRFNSKTSLIGLSCLALWIFGLVNLAIIGGSQIKNFNEKADNYTVISNLEPTSKDVLYIANLNNESSYDIDDSFELNNLFVANNNNSIKLLGKPKLRIVKSETNNYELIIKKQARSKNKKQAFKSTENIAYSWELNDSILVLDRYFSIIDEIKWKNQQLEIVIKVPVNKSIVLDSNTYKYMNIDNSNFQKYYDNYKNSCNWLMNKNGRLTSTKQNN